ncbi:DUF932 domain-containing protein [Burkholderia gladioli]
MNRNAYFARSHAPLTDDQIRAAAPSIFAEAKHESRSERYAYIPTIKIVESLRREGFQPFMASQTCGRDPDHHEHAKHMLRLRHATQFSREDAPEIVLLNSHDGSSSYRMMAGYFRFVCANGLVSGRKEQEVRIRHTGDIVDDVVAGAYEVLDGFDLIREAKASMAAVKLTQDRISITRGYSDAAIEAAITLLEARYRDRLSPDYRTLLTVEAYRAGALRGVELEGIHRMGAERIGACLQCDVDTLLANSTDVVGFPRSPTAAGLFVRRDVH